MNEKRDAEANRFNDELEQFTLHLDEEIGKTTVKPRQKSSKNDRDSLWFYVGFAGDFGFTIAVPIAGGGFLGYYLDGKWSTYPKATLALLFLGIVISIAGLIRTIKQLVSKKN